jgi:hypothetical protein
VHDRLDELQVNEDPEVEAVQASRFEVLVEEELEPESDSQINVLVNTSNNTSLEVSYVRDASTSTNAPSSKTYPQKF